MAESKKARSNHEASRPQNLSVGEMLHAARVAKNLSLEEISASIHVRSVQLRALEENNIDALPGMTYAVGFVRSYANFLGMDGVDIVHRFKAEHGHAPAAAQLSFPEPIAESRMPDPMMVGVGAFLAILVLIFWTIYSNMHNGSTNVAEQIPQAPVVTTTAESIPAAQPEIPAMTESVVPVVPVQPVKAAVIPVVPLKAAVAVEPVIPEVKVQAKEAPVEAVAAEESKAEDTAPAVNEEASKTINIKRGKTHIVVRANQDSWMQIMNAQQQVVYRKVLRPDEEYAVPDQPGLSLVTANAGGLDIFVDGQKIQSIGKPGEIVRGIILDPAELKMKKIKVRD